MSNDPLVEAGLLPLAHLPRAEQIARAQARAAEALARGRLDVQVAPIVPSPRETGARARLKLRADDRGRLGFHRAGSHDWMQVPLDGLARPEVVAEAARVEAWGGARGEVELRSDGARVVTVLSVAPGRPIDALGVADVAQGARRLAGQPTLRIAGLRVSPLSFYQVNLEINEAIVSRVDAELQRLAPARLLDLYAGIGNLSARSVARGVAATLVELDKSSSGDARANCPGAEVLAQDAGKLKAGERFFDVALLDPPRAGAPGVIPRLLVTRPRAVIYLSCEPTTLARDLGPLAGAGYRFTTVQPYEMFPGTDHVETLVVAER
jgi:23S rRNA (uracil1939-C5)-methyltransferase